MKSVLLVFHPNGDLYFSTTNHKDDNDMETWRRMGFRVLTLKLDPAVQDGRTVELLD